MSLRPPSPEGRRPRSAQGRMQSTSPSPPSTRPLPSSPPSPLTHRSPSPSHPRIPRLCSSASPAPSRSTKASPTSWSEALLANAPRPPSHPSPSLPLPLHASLSPHPAPPLSPPLPTPPSSTLSTLRLPPTPYLRAHLALLTAQVGERAASLSPSIDEGDDDVTALVKREVKREMREQERRRRMKRKQVGVGEEEKSVEADDGGEGGEGALVYPFTEHSAGLRHLILTLSGLHSSFARLTSTLTSQPSLHRLLADLSSAYLALFTSLLSSLFALNHHYHLRLHRLTFTLRALQSTHRAQVEALQQRVQLLQTSTRSSDALQGIEARQREHHTDLIHTLTSQLRAQAVDAMATGRKGGEGGEEGGDRREVDAAELGQDAQLQAHRLSLLLDALDREREEGEGGRAEFERLLVEGKRGVRELWQATLGRRREEEAGRVRERREREKRQLLSVTPSPSTPRAASSPVSYRFTASGYALDPLLSRFLHTPDGVLSPRALSSLTAAGLTLNSLNAQLLSLLLSLPSTTSATAFPSHLLSVITAAHPVALQARKHLISLFTQCTVHRAAPLPALLLPLLSSPSPSPSSTSPPSSPTPRLLPPASTPAPLTPTPTFALQVLTAGLRYFRPLIDKDLSLTPATLTSHIPYLLTLFHLPPPSPPAFPPLQSVLTGWVEGQVRGGVGGGLGVSVVAFLVHFAGAYGGGLVQWMRVMVGGRVGVDEVELVMREVDRSRWQAGGKEERGRLYVDFLERCVEAQAETESEVLHALLDCLCLHGWWLRSDAPTLPPPPLPLSSLSPSPS